MPNPLDFSGVFGQIGQIKDAADSRTPEQVLQDEYNQHMGYWQAAQQSLGGKGNGQGNEMLSELYAQHQSWLADWQKRSGQQQTDAATTQQTEQQTAANTGYDQILEQANKAYNPNSIQQYYDVAQGNLNRQAGNAGSLAMRSAGANSTNMLNPSGFIMNQLSQSQAPYAAQAGNLQATAAQAKQSGAEGLTNLLYTIQRAKQGDATAAQQLQYQYAALQQNQNQFQQNLSNNQYQFNQQMSANESSPWDTILGLASTAASLYGAGLFGSSSSTSTLTDYEKRIKELNSSGIKWLSGGE